MTFAHRPPSVTWEPFPLPELGTALWVWFKPPQAPLDILVQIPGDVSVAYGAQLTLERIVAGCGLPPNQLRGWTVQGMTYELSPETAPFLKQPLPASQTPIAIHVHPAAAAAAPPAMPMVPPAAMPMPGQPVAPQPTAPVDPNVNTEVLFQKMDSDWQAILQLETQMGLIRKQLNMSQGRLKSMNRDLNIDEAMAADNQDKRDWQDARRWLRDAGAATSRAIRDCDIGDTSAAGNRNRFEQIYNEIVVPRKPVPDLSRLQFEFESHRKTVQSVVLKMQSAASGTVREAEQRAQQVLSRIAAKVRKNRAKR